MVIPDWQKNRQAVDNLKAFHSQQGSPYHQCCFVDFGGGHVICETCGYEKPSDYEYQWCWLTEQRA